MANCKPCSASALASENSASVGSAAVQHVWPGVPVEEPGTSSNYWGPLEFLSTHKHMEYAYASRRNVPLPDSVCRMSADPLLTHENFLCAQDCRRACSISVI